jgi:predicted alpha/beta superfamily hydrolase
VSDWRPYDEVYSKTNTVSGRVVVWPKLHSEALDASRDILVYLPPSLAKSWKPPVADEPPTPANGARHYPVLYFNDGQNVFDEKTAYVGEDWRA